MALGRYEELARVLRPLAEDDPGAGPLLSSALARTVVPPPAPGSGAIPAIGPGIGFGTGSGPAQLPAGTAHFIGRERKLETLDSALGAGNLAVVTGTGGIGKTALAVHWAQRRRHLLAHTVPSRPQSPP
ncbi:hypothetical protein [Symbioplanes lichenis]|uniref:hypothetical protein n=1 Tax=Symbioplanes lichenis TaxID=1629072 RepID=UPI0027390DE3|nr:hypothetical protein [Actinoplanes lichenis]